MKKNILVVDDSTTLRSAVTFFLKSEEYNTIEAVDGIDGLKKIKELEASQTELHIMIVDINMPRLDGMGFIKEVNKTSFKDVPILVLTTEAQHEKKIAGRAAGATGWLVKPFKNQHLIDTIRMLSF